MSDLARTSITQTARQIRNPVASGVLQRQCACGQHTAASGECEACKQKREGMLQRAAVSPAPIHDMPHIVHEALRSQGQPPDAAKRAFMEPRFGHDFSRIPTHPPAAGVIQTKLAINKPGDEYEQEADRVSEQVLAAPPHPAASGAPPQIQRCAGQATEGTNTAPASSVQVHSGVAAKQLAREVNSHAYMARHNSVFDAGRYSPETLERDGLVAGELTYVAPQSASANAVQLYALPSGRRVHDPAAIHQQAERGLVGPTERLPYLNAIQHSFGHHTLEDVHAHIGGPAALASQAIGALAYTVGDDVAFREAPDLHTAAHEAAHVVQQRGGVHLDGGVGAVGDHYERHADYVANEVVWGRTSEALLDAYERGGAPDRAVQRLAQPIVTAAPASAISIRDFITLVEVEEAKWPVAEQTQTSLMITRLRKIFYGLPGWDTYLIPGASGTASGYNISEEETGRENLSLEGPDADIVRTRQVVRDASGASPAIASQQEVRLEDGTFDDIGHVFAGLDAANHPTSVSAGFGIASVADNKAAVTWTGDLGSAVTEIMFRASNAGVPTAVSDMQRIVNEYASAQDMLGDIDAYVIADQYNISNAGGRKVSELLRAYYLSAASTPDGRAREHRYSRFCSLTGLTGWTGSGFANEAAWLDRWTPEVAGAAALYFGATTSGVLAMAGRAGSISAIQSPTNPVARLLLQKFLDALKTRVAAEAP